MSSDKNIEDDVDEIIADVAAHTEQTLTLASPTRQILNVSSTVYFSAGTVISSANPTPQSQSYIKLSGTPTPSSEVVQGFIRFVPADQIKAPRYIQTRKEIVLWVDRANIAMTLEQMNHNNRYLWIGFFSGGHVYSDLHTSN